ncbi:reverse transcriptase domain-containing protein [Tanacetum coccineum]
MRTRSSSNLVGNSSSNPTTSNPKRRNRRRSKQPFSLEESPVDTMIDQRTMTELLRAPTEGYAEAIMVPPILAEHFKLKHSLINMMTSDQFSDSRKTILMTTSVARRWLEKEPPCSILTWEDLSFHEAWDRYKDLLRACPHHGFTKLHQLDTFYNALNPVDQDSLNSAAGGNLLERSTQDVLTIIENKSKFPKLTHAVNQQTSVVTTAMTAILKQFQATPPPAFVKAVEEIYVTCGGAHPYYQCLAADGNTFPEYQVNIQGYVVAAAGNYNQGNSGYRPPSVANQTRPPSLAQPNVQNNQNRFSQPQGYNRGNNFNQNATYQAPIQQNQSVPLNELEKFKKTNEANMKAMQNQINNMNTASTSGTGSLPSNTVANPKDELKAITTRSGLVLDGPPVLMPPPFINPEEDERVEETLTDLERGEFTIKVPPPLLQKAKPPSQRNYVVHQRDPRHPHIPYPSRMNQEKRQEKDEVQIHKFWQMFKQLHINISLADALILIPKYQKMLKSLLSNKEKLLELANTPLNENCSSVILKKLPEKLGDPRKFLIPCGFSELKCKALADLGASINLMPLSVWKKLGLPELIPTQMTLELANWEICTLVEIARDVFVPVGKFTFPADFVIVDYESDPHVLLILGRPFLRTARALIDVHGEEMILRDESINMIDVYNVSHEEILEDLSSSSPTLTSIEESDLIWEEFEAYLVSDSFPPGNSNPSSPLHPFHNSLSGSTTSSSPSLSISETNDYSLEEFADELAHFTFPLGIDYLPFDAESDLREIEYLLNHDPIKEMDSILEDSVDSPDDNLVDTITHPHHYRMIMMMNFLILISSSDFLPSPECDLVFYEDFFEVDALSSTNNEDKKATNASLILEDFNPPLYELPFYKEVSGSETLLPFSSENEEKVFNLRILTSKGVHTSLLPELSHRDTKAFKVINFFESPMEIFPCSYGEDIRVLDVPCLHFYPP